MNGAEIIRSMKEGARLFSSHPYKGGRKFTAHLDTDGSFVKVSKRVFFSLLNNGTIGNATGRTNREYEYFLTS